MSKLKISLIMLSLSLALFGTAMVPVEAQVGGCSTTHIVQRGETLYRIALQYRTSIADLQARNSISNPNRIYAGQRLCISGGFVPQPNPNPNPGDYTPNGSLRVTTYTLNIRTGPGLQYAVVAQARYGNTFPVMGRTWDSNWYQIAYGVGGAGEPGYLRR